MGKIGVRHWVEKPSGYYFQATPAMKDAGIHSESLGRDMAKAIARANALNDEWDKIRKGEEAPAIVPAPKGTFAWLVRELRRDTDEYSDKKPATIAEFDYAMKIIDDKFGKHQIRAIMPKHCKLFYTGLRNEGSVHRAARVMKWFRYVLGYAVKMNWLGANPTLAVRVKQPKARTQLWTETEIDAVTAKAKELRYPSMAMAIMIGYDTSLRPIDIRALQWKQFDGESLWVVQEKTERLIRVPLYPETIEALKAHRRAGGAIQHDETYIVRNLRGMPYTKDGFSHVFRDICRESDLPDNLQFRDIRRTASSERANAGATEMELTDSTGHSPKTSAKVIQTYNPPNYERAKTAQAKRRRKKEEREKNEKEGKV